MKWYIARAKLLEDPELYEALLKAVEIEARINELEKWTYCGAEADEIKDRIAELKAYKDV